MKTFFSRPNGLFCENIETVISCRGPEPTRKKKEVPGIPVVERRRAWVHVCVCPCVKTIGSRTHVVAECYNYKEERDALEEKMRKLDECDLEEVRRQRVAR